MKKILMPLFLLAHCPAFAASPVIGKVIDLSGQAWRVQGRFREPLSKGSELHDHDQVKTAKDAKVIARLGTDSAFLLKSDSAVDLHQTPKSDWRLDLKQGAILSRVTNPKNAPLHFSVKTRSAVMGVRGTSFFLEVRANQPLFFCTCMGKVEVSRGRDSLIIESMHHDRPVLIQDGKEPLQSRTRTMVAGELDINHSDEEIHILDQAVASK